MCGHLGRPDLITDDRTRTSPRRAMNRDFVNELMIEWTTSSHTTAEVVEILGGDVPVGPVNDAPALFASEHVKAREMLVKVDHPGSERPAVLPEHAAAVQRHAGGHLSPSTQARRAPRRDPGRGLGGLGRDRRGNRCEFRRLRSWPRSARPTPSCGSPPDIGPAACASRWAIELTGFTIDGGTISAGVPDAGDGVSSAWAAPVEAWAPLFESTPPPFANIAVLASLGERRPRRAESIGHRPAAVVAVRPGGRARRRAVPGTGWGAGARAGGAFGGGHRARQRRSAGMSTSRSTSTASRSTTACTTRSRRRPATNASRCCCSTRRVPTASSTGTCSRCPRSPITSG